MSEEEFERLVRQAAALVTARTPVDAVASALGTVNGRTFLLVLAADEAATEAANDLELVTARDTMVN